MQIRGFSGGRGTEERCVWRRTFFDRVCLRLLAAKETAERRPPKLPFRCHRLCLGRLPLPLLDRHGPCLPFGFLDGSAPLAVG